MKTFYEQNQRFIKNLILILLGLAVYFCGGVQALIVFTFLFLFLF